MSLRATFFSVSVIDGSDGPEPNSLFQMRFREAVMEGGYSSRCQTDPVSTTSPGPFRSLALLGTTAVLFAIGLILELWGGLNFPSNAPVEQIYCAGLILDIAAGFAAATTGAIIAARHRFPLKRSSVSTIVGIILVGVALAAWIALSGIGIVMRIPTGDRGRYMDDVLGLR